MKEIEQTGGQDGAQIAQLYTEKDELLKWEKMNKKSSETRNQMPNNHK